MPDNQTAEVKFNWVIDKDGVKIIDAMTGAVRRLNEQEEELYKKLERNKRIMEEQSKAAERQKRSASTVLGERGFTGPTSEADIIAQEVRAAAKSRAAAASRLQSMGMNTSGQTVAEEAAAKMAAAKRAQAVKAAMGGGGGAAGASYGEALSGAMGMMTPGAIGAMAPITALVAAGHMASVVNQQNSRAFLFEDDRERQGRAAVMNEIPLIAMLERARMGLHDAGFNRGGRERISTERDFAAQMEQQRTTAGYDIDRQHFDNPVDVIARGNLMAATVRQKDPQFLPSANLSTVAGQRQRGEDEKTIVIMKRNADAKAAIAQADMKNFSARLQIQQEDKRNTKALDDIAKAEWKFNEERRLRLERGEAGVRPEEIEAGKALIRARDSMVEIGQRRAEALNLERDSATDKLRAQKEERDTRGGYGAKTGGVEFLRSRQGILEGRAEEARGQTMALGYAGPAGRYASQAALEQLRMHGTEFAPPELLSQAASLYRPEVDKMIERQGAGVAEAQRVAPDTYKFNLKDVRAEMESNAKQIEELTLQSAKMYNDELYKTLSAFAQNLVASLKANELGKTLFKDFEQMLQNNQGNK